MSITINGTAGNDTLTGTKADETLLGGAGNDTLYDGSQFSGTEGNTTLVGGAGDDVFRLRYTQWSKGEARVDGGEGADLFDIQQDAGGERILTITGGNGADTYKMSSSYHAVNFKVADFVAGDGPQADRIDLTAMQFSAAGNPFDPAFGFFKLVQAGADVLLQYDRDGAAGSYYGAQTIMTLSNVSAGALTSNNFVHGLRPDGSPMPGEVLTGTDGADSLTGWLYNDTLDGGAGNDTLSGGYGDDVLHGGDGNDLLKGDVGNDSLYGGDGDDTLNGTYNDKYLDGGAGNDVLSNYGGNTTMLGGDGNDRLVLDDGEPTMTVRAEGGAGDDLFVYYGDTSGSRFMLTGGAGVDTYGVHQSLRGVTRIEIADFTAGAGGDRIDLIEQLEASAAWPDGYAGGNPFAADIGYYRLVQQGADTLFQFDADGLRTGWKFATVYTLKNVVATALTADNFVGAFAPDGASPGLKLAGTDGADTLTGSRLDDAIDGAGGADKIEGGFGNDTLYGGTGDDTLGGGAGNDTVDGGSGDDVLYGGPGDDLINGGAGNDIMDAGSGSVMTDGTGGVGRDTLLGGEGDDRITAWASSVLDGGAGNDILSGGGSVLGGAGDDLIYVHSGGATVFDGGEGNDTLQTGDYNETLNATMTGGGGSDIFRIASHAIYLNGTYTVTDFTAGAGGDQIDLLPLLASRDAIGYLFPDLLALGVPLFKLVQQGQDTLLQVSDGITVNSDYFTLLVLKNVDAATLTAANFHGVTLDGLGGAGLLIEGGAGGDELLGAHFADTLRGGDGNDTLIGGRGNDLLDGGAGDDVIYLGADQGSDTVRGGDGNDHIVLSNDVVSSATAQVTIDAGAGDDLLTFNGSGRGVISATIAGGAGSDTYSIKESRELGRLVVTDFAAGAGGDRIDLEGLLTEIGYGTDTGGNPFRSGLLRLAQDGADTVLQTHPGHQPSGDWQTVLRLSDVQAASLTADNFVGHVDPGGAPVRGLVLTAIGGEVVSGGRYNDTLVGGDGNNFLAGEGGDDRLAGGDGNDYLDGGHGDDSVDAGAGDDSLRRGGDEGNDTLLGGDGNDTFELSDYEAGERVLADGGAGDDRFDVHLIGDSNDLFLRGGDGVDTYRLHTQFGGSGRATVQDFSAGAGGDRIDLDDFLAYTGSQGGDPAWRFDGSNPFATGHARLVQQGADTLVQLDEDGIGPEAIHTVLVLQNVLATALTSANFKNGFAPGGTASGGLNLTGSVFSESIAGSIGADRLIGGGGSDTIEAGMGDDWVYSGDESGDARGDVLYGGEGRDTLIGGAGADYLSGDAGNDSLDGGAGVDGLDGGNGDDVYRLADNADTVREASGGGRDTVQLAWTVTGTHQLAINVEVVTAAASTVGVRVIGNDQGDVMTGGAFADTLEGGAGNDTLDGGAGANQLKGGAGDDVYLVRALSDAVIEVAGDGVDRVETGLSTYTLGANVEQLAYTGKAAFVGIGNAGDNLLAGGAGNDRLDGGAGNDTLDGGAGADTLRGGAGDDAYIVAQAADVVTELAGEGRDTVRTALSAHTLVTNVENLTYTGTAAFAGTGNALDNAIAGGDGGATLSGLAGNDSLIGGTGNDSLQGGLGDDVLTGGGGKDSIDGGDGVDALGGLRALADYTIARPNAIDTVLTDTDGNVLTVRGVENFRFADGERPLLAIQMDIASAGNDYLHGTRGDDVLDGGTGVDTMDGSEGNDTYVVSNAATQINERGAEGYDQVQVALTAPGTYVMAMNVENATVTAAAGIAVNVTGNELDNIIIGNAAVNTLIGGDGNDTLDGLAGADRLNGGVGNDRYIVGAGDVVAELANEGADTIETTLASYTLGANVENLVYAGAGSFNGTGNALNNLLAAGASGVIDGGAGDGDTVVVKGDFASYTVTRPNATDTVLKDAAGNLLTLRNVEIVRFADGDLPIGQVQVNIASPGNDVLIGTTGADLLDGGAGADTLSGGLGDDIYVIANKDAQVREWLDEGIDLVRVALTAAGTYVLAANVENATVAAAATVAVNLTGNELDNRLTGNAAANTLLGGAGNDKLDGGAGSDKLTGGSGDDIYVVDVAGDVVTELANDGGDTVETTLASYVLGANVENLGYKGSTAFNGKGNELANRITAGNGGATLDGAAGNDTLTGGSGNDGLQGGLGDDMLTAGGGKDTIDGGVGADLAVVLGNVADYAVTRPNATDTVLTGLGGSTVTLRNVETIRFADGDKTIDQLQFNIASVGNDKLNGTAGNDVMNGGLGIDTLTGGAGDDTYVIGNAATAIIEAAGDGVDLAQVALTSAGTYVLASNVENATVTSAATVAANLTGNELNNVLTGNAAANTLTGGAGDDTLVGGAGNDKLLGGSGNDSYVVDAAADVVTELANEGYDSVRTTLATYALGLNVEELSYAGNTAFRGTGNLLNNVISGGNGGAILDGAAGNDTLSGGSGNDSLSGGAGDDVLFAGGGKDTVDGGTGDDSAVLSGAFASYTVMRPNAADTVLTDAQGNIITLRNIDKVRFADGVKTIAEVQDNTASFGNDALFGTGGNDTLDGGLGNDTMTGAGGDDTYILSAATDVVIEQAGGGDDTVRLAFGAAGTYTMAANVETAIVTAAAAVAVNVVGNNLGVRIVGNAAANKLTGGDGIDTLDGGVGKDTLTGGAGGDTYLVDDAGDVIVEAEAASGADQVLVSAASYVMAANLERMAYTGAGKFVGIGNSGDNVIDATASTGATLDGGVGNDMLLGGSGNDSLIGGAGDDLIDGRGGKDSIDGGAGDDRVALAGVLGDYTVARPTLADTVLTDKLGNVITVRNVEHFDFASGGALTLARVQNNVSSVGGDGLTGTSGDDVIDGGAGNDTLTGGLGDDIYVLDRATDVVVEAADAGIDGVRLAFTAAGTYVLTDNVENATVTAAASIAVGVTGNELDNALTGNAAANTLIGGLGNDTLNGGAGNDSLVGGAGDDVYVVDAAGDRVVEAANGGIDRVHATAGAYTLAANVEDLLYTGKLGFVGGGNELGNNITGGIGADVLSGAAGNDVLTGGAGADRLVGGIGADTFVFDSLMGFDTVADFVSGTDHLRISQAGIALGNGDAVLDGGVLRNGPGGFGSEAELVVFSQRMATATTANAAKAIGSADGAYAVGQTVLFAVSTTSATSLYLFTSNGNDAVVSAAELTQVAVLTGTPSTALGDYMI
jgi:Ca2+-binding RTX toxin-like protein